MSKVLRIIKQKISLYLDENETFFRNSYIDNATACRDGSADRSSVGGNFVDDPAFDVPYDTICRKTNKKIVYRSRAVSCGCRSLTEPKNISYKSDTGMVFRLQKIAKWKRSQKQKCNKKPVWARSCLANVCWCAKVFPQ